MAIMGHAKWEENRTDTEKGKGRGKRGVENAPKKSGFDSRQHSRSHEFPWCFISCFCNPVTLLGFLTITLPTITPNDNSHSQLPPPLQVGLPGSLFLPTMKMNACKKSLKLYLGFPLKPPNQEKYKVPKKKKASISKKRRKESQTGYEIWQKFN